jgi:hemolysin activation/secretion protein
VKKKSFYINCIYFAVSVTSVYADNVGDASKEADKIIRLQQQQLEQQRKDEMLNRSKTVIPVEAVRLPEQQSIGICTLVTEIEIEHADMMADDVRQEIVRKYKGKCLGIGEIERLIGEIVNTYIARGYISVRAYVQPQDLANGKLRILVIEGSVESININHNESLNNDNINLSTAFPWIEGRILNIRDIEQGLDQINRLSSNSATMRIEPGKKAGGSRIVIENIPSYRLHLNTSVDNYGSSSTGERQGSAFISIDNPLNLNDLFTYSHTRTLNTDFASQHSMVNAISYSIPFGYTTLSLSHSRSDYAATIHAAGGDLLSEGDTKNTSLSMEYVAYRDTTDRLSFDAAMGSKGTNSYLEKQYLNVSSRKLSTFTLGTAWNSIFLGGGITMTLNHVWGMKWFDALEDPDYLPETSPHAQFRKWTYGVNWMKPFQIGEKSGLYSVSLNGQYGTDVLYGSEQFSIGGLYSVRGSRNSSIAGDTGFYVRNDIAFPNTFSIDGKNCRIKPSIGFDFGEIRDRYGEQGGFMSGLNGGINIAYSAITFDLSVSRSLSKPDTLKDESTLVFAKLNIGF